MKRSATIAVCIAALLFAFVVIRWTLGNAASTRAEQSEVGAITTQLAPDDPQTHYSVAVLLEKEFELSSLDAAVKEYEAAAALSPNNYLYWLSLGTARERAGDRDGAELALRRAKELAPHYSRVHWALGNALVRQGKLDEGFTEIRQAVAADPALAQQSISLAMQLFGGDLGLVRQRIGDS
ncbi:MAG TPA: tetratricopeptide repeat protein, partial [Pyrinomonadaceae bacterium]|nr:tetratricopeptide repeat protein [Pyrinomonadaceae bacterium]